MRGGVVRAASLAQVPVPHMLVSQPETICVGRTSARARQLPRPRAWDRGRRAGQQAAAAARQRPRAAEARPADARGGLRAARGTSSACPDTAAARGHA